MMQRGKAIEVRWTIEDDNGDKRAVWWPALVWSTRTHSPGDTTARLAYARAHGSRAHLAQVHVLDARRLWDPEHNIDLPYRSIDIDRVEFSAEDLVHLTEDDISLESPEDLQQAERALAALPEAAQRAMWRGMETFRGGAARALRRARDAGEDEASVPTVTAAQLAGALPRPRSA